MKVEDGPSVTARQTPGMIEVAQSRAAQEVQAAMIVAKKFPRNEQESRKRILEACKSLGLAEESQYEYSRGGTEITGPSIRLLEAVARAWGNCEAGTIELERMDGKSIAMSYSVDLETNYRETRIFEVEHVRETRKGNYRVTDPRDIYELIANQGSRRRRACMEAIFPNDVVDEAVVACNETLKGAAGKEDLPKRIPKLIKAFGELGVTPEMIRGRLNKNVEATTEIDMARLRRIYQSIKDGMGSVADFFEVSKPDIQDGKQGFGFKKDKGLAGEGQPQGQKPGDEKKDAQAPPTQVPETPLTAPPAVGTPSPPSQPGQSVSDLMRRIMVQSKETGVKLETIERWASKTYSQNLVGCSVLNLQTILLRLQHGQGFEV